MLKHLVAVVLVALAVGVLFLQEPGFGDDLTYWSFAFDLHERGLVAWQVGSFHDLRWPVWGVCWVLQAMFGPGLASYYGVPLLYLAAGAVLAFVFAHRLSQSLGVAWAAAIAFTFHPLLDTVCDRPMPDLSEGVLGAAIMLCWWELMRSPGRGRAVLFAVLTGVGVFVIEANRVTGVFIVFVLLLGTLVYFPRRFGWLVWRAGSPRCVTRANAFSITGFSTTGCTTFMPTRGTRARRAPSFRIRGRCPFASSIRCGMAGRSRRSIA